jgi:hypothetical protein
MGTKWASHIVCVKPKTGATVVPCAAMHKPKTSCHAQNSGFPLFGCTALRKSVNIRRSMRVCRKTGTTASASVAGPRETSKIETLKGQKAMQTLTTTGKKTMRYSAWLT